MKTDITITNKRDKNEETVSGYIKDTNDNGLILKRKRTIIITLLTEK